MNYHIEGVFHAEHEYVDRWHIWSNLSVDDFKRIPGVGLKRHDAKEGKATIAIHILYTPDNVLGKLMELAQRKHDRGKCCDEHVVVYATGDTHISQGCAHSTVYIIAHDGEIHYIGLGDGTEPATVGGWVAVKQEDLDRIHDIIEDMRGSVRTCEDTLDHALELLGKIG